MNPLPLECARLAAELDTLRHRAALSIAALAGATSYSKSSWHRYLNGTALPPWGAVSALSRLADEPDARLRALWTLAEAAWSRRDAVATPHREQSPAPEVPATEAPAPAPVTPAPTARPAEIAPRVPGRDGRPDGSRTGRRRRARLAGLPAVLFAATAAGVVLLVGALLTGGAGVGPGASAATAQGFHVGCSGRSCDGRDPQATLCGVSPQTLLHRETASGVGVEIRYSPDCRAAWARVWNTRLGDGLSISGAGLPTERVTVDDRRLQDAFVYTPLLAVDGRLTACLSESDGPRSCWTATVK